jgi:hypothetical protein
MVFIIGNPYQSNGQIISTFAGNGLSGYSGDGGAATVAQLDTPTCLAVDGANNIYINDQRNNCIRKVSPNGVITTVAGNGLFGFLGDNGPATAARLGFNWGVAADKDGNLFIADQSNNRVRKVGTDGIITTIAGTGVAGYSGDGGAATAAKIKTPIGIAVDVFGNVFIGDADNFCVRKINTAGVITTYAGNGVYGYGGDGGAAISASISYIWGLATDGAGNLYICDGPNNRVRKVSTTGIMTTVAGAGGAGAFAGDGGPATAARLNQPLGVYVSPNGTLFISDCKNNRLRKVGADGIISTVAGTGIEGYNGDGIPATSARLHHPIGVVMDTNENVYVSDLRNVRVRKIINILAFVAGDNTTLGACQNSGPLPVNDQLAVRDVYIGLTNNWTLEVPPVNGTASVGYSTVSTGDVLVPTGLTYTPNPGYAGPDSFKVRVTNSLATDVITVYVTVDPMLSPGVINGPSSVCLGDTVLLTTTVAGGTWGSADGRVAITGKPAGGVVMGLTAGVDIIDYYVGNACGTVVATKQMTINSLPDPGTVSGPSALCLGNTVMFTSSLPGGTWTTSNLNASVDMSGTVKGLAAGTVTIIYTISDTVCKAAAIRIINIETFPNPGVITGPVNVCLGDQILLEASVPGGVWSSNFGYALVSLGMVTGVAIGNEFINYSLTNTCGTAIATRPVSVHPVPDVPTITVDQGMLHATIGYASYQWRVNGVDIPGANADSFFANTAGVFEVTVANTFGCVAASMPLDYAGCGPEDLELFPNPVTGALTIIWCRKVTARISTIDGREVGRVSDADKLVMRNLPAGMYLLSVYDNNGILVKTSKIVKLH